MNFANRIAFDPGLPWGVFIALALAVAALWLFYAFRGGRARILRAAGLTLILIGLAQPLWVSEQREPKPDIAAVIVDRSESLELAGRAEAADRAANQIIEQLRKDEGLELRVREVTGGPDGTQMVTALEETLADAPRDRIAGAILITDGQISDAPKDTDRLRPLGPVHSVIVGDPARGDRRLELINAPAFGIVGETVPIEARIDDPKAGGQVRVQVQIDGQFVREVSVTAGKPFTVSVRVPKRGANLVTLEAEAGPQEISAANNRAAFRLAGVRDRLRVLLVTGEPHPGARVWRNLLKSDPSVDLVHFTILRPPEKQDDTPLEELSLIAFPTRELFVEKLGSFDLIIFDRYERRGILPLNYFDNIARRVEDGGALLVAAGPGDAGDDSLHRTPLAAILPGQPTGEIIDQPFRPQITALGQRHPVTRGLPRPEGWGRWTRQIGAGASGGQTVLSGNGGRPLLTLDRAGKGRVAQLWSDQAWLWARGYDGGGPHGELLRRLAHWLMQEPELEDERLTLESTPEGLALTRATLGEAPAPVTLIAPDATTREITLQPTSPGLYRGVVEAPRNGIYEARSGGLRAFAAVGPLNPKEAANLTARTDLLEPLARASGGGIMAVGEQASPLPDVRRVGANDSAHGNGWIGLKRREGFVVRASAAEPLGPGWAWAFAGLILLMLGWRREAD
jgi:uncharacterized membrane protein